MAWRWTRRFVESFPSQATWWAATTSVWKRSFFYVATRLLSSPRVFCQPSKAGACQRKMLRLYRCGHRWMIYRSFPKITSGRDNMDATERSILSMPARWEQNTTRRASWHSRNTFEERNDVRIIVISEGAGIRYLQKRKGEIGLENLDLPAVSTPTISFPR